MSCFHQIQSSFGAQSGGLTNAGYGDRVIGSACLTLLDLVTNNSFPVYDVLKEKNADRCNLPPPKYITPFEKSGEQI